MYILFTATFPIWLKRSIENRSMVTIAIDTFGHACYIRSTLAYIQTVGLWQKLLKIKISLAELKFLRKLVDKTRTKKLNSLILFSMT